jgi:hypothetical protein
MFEVVDFNPGFLDFIAMAGVAVLFEPWTNRLVDRGLAFPVLFGNGSGGNLRGCEHGFAQFPGVSGGGTRGGTSDCAGRSGPVAGGE